MKIKVRQNENAVVNDAKNESFITGQCRDIVNLSSEDLMLNFNITKITAIVASMMISV